MGFWVTYENSFMGRTLRYGDRVRVLKSVELSHRSICPRIGVFRTQDSEEQWSRFDMEIHEHPQLRGPVGTLSQRIPHDSFRGLKSYIDKHHEYSSWEARRVIELQARPSGRAALTRPQRLKYGLLDNWLFPPAYFLVSYFLRGGVLDGVPGAVFWLLKMKHFYQVRFKILEERTARAAGRGSGEV